MKRKQNIKSYVQCYTYRLIVEFQINWLGIMKQNSKSKLKFNLKCNSNPYVHHDFYVGEFNLEFSFTHIRYGKTIKLDKINII